MPGLLTLRPLASAPKAAKSTVASKNAAVSASRAEKGRDDARPQGQMRAVSPAFPRARVLRASDLYHDAPAAPHHHHLRRHAQQQHGVPTQAEKQLALVNPATGRIPAAGATTTKQATDLLIGNNAAAAAANQKQFGPVDVTQRMGGVPDYSSSGSEHEPNSVCLAEMVYDYIEDDFEVSKCGRTRCNCGNSCSGGERSPKSVKENDDSSLGGETSEVLQGLIFCSSPCEKIILASVTSALAALEREHDGSESDDGENGSALSRSPSTRRLVMSALRSSGHNAAVCKSRWEHAGGFPGGDYEYIDVIVNVAGKRERIVVDLDFRTQFEIARPTSLYSVLLQSLPSIYVGQADRLQQIVNIMCDSAKRSLKKKGLHLPPWRKPDYIRAKWLSAYRRTTKGAASHSAAKSADGNIDIGQIALRVSGWDSKFTMEMEKCYTVKGSDHFPMALRERTVEQQNLDDKTGATIVVLPQQKLMKSQLPEPEGKVRGVNLLGSYLRVGNGNSEYVAAVGEFDPTMPTDWEPPSVIPRLSTQRATAGKGKVLGGLVSILKESASATALPKEEEEASRRAPDLQHQVAVTALHRHHAGALSKPMAVA
ncbi:unnamed protein product [Calypogeia fissa]